MSTGSRATCDAGRCSDTPGRKWTDPLASQCSCSAVPRRCEYSPAGRRPSVCWRGSSAPPAGARTGWGFVGPIDARGESTTRNGCDRPDSRSSLVARPCGSLPELGALGSGGSATWSTDRGHQRERSKAWMAGGAGETQAGGPTGPRAGRGAGIRPRPPAGSGARACSLSGSRASPTTFDGASGASWCPDSTQRRSACSGAGDSSAPAPPPRAPSPRSRGRSSHPLPRGASPRSPSPTWRSASAAALRDSSRGLRALRDSLRR
jgi:hypothetical protein